MSKESLELINKLGFDIKEEEMIEINSDNSWSEMWTGEAFAEVLLNNPKYGDNELLLPYREGGERSDNPYVNFYWDYFAQEKPCFVEIIYPDMDEIIDTIHKNNGKAVLAHPGVNLANKFDMIKEIIPLGIDGIEAYSSYHDNDTNKYFVNIAKENDLIITHGSDFHGKTKPSVKLGHSGKLID